MSVGFSEYEKRVAARRAHEAAEAWVRKVAKKPEAYDPPSAEGVGAKAPRTKKAAGKTIVRKRPSPLIDVAKGLAAVSGQPLAAAIDGAAAIAAKKAGKGRPSIGEPWVELGISKRTYFRRKAEGKL